jgi:hypothetical protein
VVPLPVVSTGDEPRIATDATGNFVVVWGGIQAQRFDRDGTALGAPFQVNTYTTGIQEYPSVAMTPRGQFVVTWQGANDGSGIGIGARLYNTSGAPTTGEFVVNSYTTADQFRPAVAMDAAGNFVVAWHGSYYEGPPSFEEPVMSRRFDASGAALGADFIVTTEDYYVSGHLDVASSAAGDFIVSWETYGTSRPSFVDNAARRFDADGTPEGPQFFVGDYTGYAHYDPSAGATPDGAFMVVWNDFRGFFTDATAGSNVEDAIVGRYFPASEFRCAPVALTTCQTPTVPLKSKLVLRDDADDTRDQLRWTFVKGEATSPSELGDPTANEDYVVCMYDASTPGGAVLMEHLVPAGGTCATKPCWRGSGSPPGFAGYRYKDPEGTPHGIQKMSVKPGPHGKPKIAIKGGRDHLFSAAPGAPPLPLPLPVVMQLQNRSGACWQATFDASGISTNVSGSYKGSGS